MVAQHGQRHRAPHQIVPSMPNRRETRQARASTTYQAAGRTMEPTCHRPVWSLPDRRTRCSSHRLLFQMARGKDTSNCNINHHLTMVGYRLCHAWIPEGNQVRQRHVFHLTRIQRNLSIVGHPTTNRYTILATSERSSRKIQPSATETHFDIQRNWKRLAKHPAQHVTTLSNNATPKHWRNSCDDVDATRSPNQTTKHQPRQTP